MEARHLKLEYDLYIDTDLHAGLLLFNFKKPE